MLIFFSVCFVSSFKEVYCCCFMVSCVIFFVLVMLICVCLFCIVYFIDIEKCLQRLEFVP